MILKYLIIESIIPLFVTQYLTTAELTEIVETNKGFVQGEILHTDNRGLDYSIFRGIPYARPPLSYNRFRDASEADPWEGVLDATQNPNSCPQWHPKFRHFIGEEDCLYLNVYTPELNFTNPNSRPVLVWIHGGSFLHGSIDGLNNPDIFMEKDFVIVAMNYRLGALGFLSLNSTLANGNVGLKDQLLALRWIEKNIHKFGGDRKNITIYGKHADAVSVELHNLFGETVGLFNGSIVMTDALLNSWGLSDHSKSLEYTYRLLEKLGIDEKTLQEIYNRLVELNPEEIVNATQEIILETMDIPFKPIIDTYRALVPFLMKCPKEEYTIAEFNKDPKIFDFIKEISIFFETLFENLSYTNNNAALTSADEPEIDVPAFIMAKKRNKPVYKYKLVDFSEYPQFYYHITFDYESEAIRQQERKRIDPNAYIVCSDESPPGQCIEAVDPDQDIIDERDSMVTMWSQIENYGGLPMLNDDARMDEIGVLWTGREPDDNRESRSFYLDFSFDNLKNIFMNRNNCY